MIKASLISFYSRLEDYPSKLSLSSMRLGAYIAAQPNLSNLELKILPLNLNDSVESLGNDILRTKTDIVGLPCYMWTTEKSREVAKFIVAQNPNILAIAGGPDTTNFNYENWPKNTFFVVGEGEEPLHWIFKTKLSNPNFNSETTSSLHPSIYSHTVPRNTIKSITEKKTETSLATGIPLFSQKFLTLFDSKNLDTTFTWHDTEVSCPYTCGYCGHKTRSKVAFRNDELVEEEIKEIGKLMFKEVYIIDPILGGIPGRDKQILKWYQKHAPSTAINAYYRPEYFDDQTIKLLSESNIKEILIGLQSTNPDVPKWLRSNNLEKVKTYLPQLSKNKIPNRIELITGLPGDTPLGQRASLKFVVEEIKPLSIWSYPLTIIPGTKLYSILDADNKGQNFWVHSNPLNCKATESSSYSSKELNYMLIYGGAITSFYNFVQHNSIKNFNTIEQFERVITPVINSNEEAVNLFKTGNMKKSIQFWENEK